MYRTHLVLALLALYVGLAHSFSWDVVVGGSNLLQFYNINNGTLTHTEVISTDHDGIRSLAYDPVHHRVLLAGSNRISSYDIENRKIQPIYTSITSKFIQIAYDPATQILFYLDEKKNLYNSDVSKPGSEVYMNFVINFERDEAINYIAVDSCGGYIYWTTNSNIEKAKFYGSGRQVVIDEQVFWRGGIAIDQQTQRMYWIENRDHGDRYLVHIESSDLYGAKRRTLDIKGMIFHNSVTVAALTVSKNFIYWKMYGLWQLSKNPPRNRDGNSTKISVPDTEFYEGIASNYKIKEQNYCGALSRVPTKNSVPSDYDSLSDSIDETVCHNYCFQGDCSVSAEGHPKCRCNAGYSGLRCEVNECHEYCLNNGVCSVNADSKPVCQCTEHYEGERCNLLVCQNYCFQGDCSASAEGKLICRCNAGYSGDRCELNACHGYCLNFGVCSLNAESKPVCRCTGGYEGERCDISDFIHKCLQTVSMFRDILNTD